MKLIANNTIRLAPDHTVEAGEVFECDESEGALFVGGGSARDISADVERLSAAALAAQAAAEEAAEKVKAAHEKAAAAQASAGVKK